MNPHPIVSCLFVLGAALVTLVWLCLLLASLFFRPAAKQKIIGSGVTRVPPTATTARTIAPAINRPTGRSSMRPLEAMLIVASALMFLAAAGLSLLVKAIPH